MSSKKEKILPIILILIGIFNVADYFFTLHAINLGYPELNPVINKFIDTPYFLPIKLIMAPLLLLLIWTIRNYIRRVIFLVYVLFGVYATLMLYFATAFINGTL